MRDPRRPGAKPRCESGCEDPIRPEIQREIDALRDDPKLAKAMRDEKTREALRENPLRVFRQLGLSPSGVLARRLRRATNAKLRAEIASPPGIRLPNGCTIEPKVRLRIVERLEHEGEG